MYEVFEHTADIGLRVTAPTLDELLVEAARGLISLIVENLDDVRPRESVPIRVEGEDPAFLLFDWLAALLLVLDTRGLLLAEFDVRPVPGGVEATARGEPLDETRHRLLHEVKAITYHGLVVERVEGGWRAEVVVDV